jgi:NTE family protein
MDRLSLPGTMRFSPLWMATDAMFKLFSPYQLNPLNQNPLRQLLEDLVDFPRLRKAERPAAFVCATNVLNGRLKVFARHEMSAAAVMASGCLPQLFQAVEVDGEHYWDGGYSGNPPIFPLIYMGGCPDIIIVQLNPINIPAVPRDMRAIMDRINTLAFNSSLMITGITCFVNNSQILTSRDIYMLLLSSIETLSGSSGSHTTIILITLLSVSPPSFG